LSRQEYWKRHRVRGQKEVPQVMYCSASFCCLRNMPALSLVFQHERPHKQKWRHRVFATSIFGIRGELLQPSAEALHTLREHRCASKTTLSSQLSFFHPCKSSPPAMIKMTQNRAEIKQSLLTGLPHELLITLCNIACSEQGWPAAATHIVSAQIVGRLSGPNGLHPSLKIFPVPGIVDHPADAVQHLAVEPEVCGMTRPSICCGRI